IDPHTGKPINNYVVSVTVIDASSMTADGLATGLMVMGEQAGMAVAELENIPAMMIIKTEDGFVERVSSAYKQYQN
ncbi:FAD:protein FMN transferase, partial [Vibrio campbellii]